MSNVNLVLMNFEAKQEWFIVLNPLTCHQHKNKLITGNLRNMNIKMFA